MPKPIVAFFVPVTVSSFLQLQNVWVPKLVKVASGNLTLVNATVANAFVAVLTSFVFDKSSVCPSKSFGQPLNDWLPTLVSSVNSSRLTSIINDNIKDDEKITLIPCDGLANAIENNDEDKIKNLLDNLLNSYRHSDVDAVVLGCTHYPHIKDKIQSYFPEAVLIDGNIGVANRVKYMLETNNLLSNSKTEGNVEFIQTKKED